MYRLTDEQQRIVDRATEIANSEVLPHAVRVDAEGVYPGEAMAALAREGFWGLTVPAEFGGMGQGPRVICAVLDQIAQRCASTAMCYKMHLCGVAAYAVAPDKTGDYLRAAARGEHLSTLAWSEFGSRSHFWVPVSRERRENGMTTINAAKSFVTSAGEADGYVVSTAWAEARSPTESTLYAVLKNDPGVRIAGPWNGLGMRGNMSGPMNLDDVRVGEDRLLTEPGKGLETILNVVLPVFNLGNAAVSIGIAEAAVGATLRHITTARFQYLDSSLADVPIERARLAQVRMEVDRARAHLASAVDSVEDPGPNTMLLVLEAKASAAETALHVTDIALRACGGTGFTPSLGLERNFRDARAASVMGPTTDLIYEFIGKALCGMELFE